MSTQRPNLWRLISESSHIIGAQPRHFSALSVLFLLPISISTLIYQFLLRPDSIRSGYGRSQLHIQITYLIFATVFGLCGSASITYSTVRGFYGKRVTLTSSLKSIMVSFYLLLSTKLVAQIIVALVIFGFGVSMVLAYNGLLLLGLEMDYDSLYFLIFVILIAALVVAAMIYVEVGWCLTTAVVVVESRWGFAPLKRSWHLVKGMRWVAFSKVVVFLILGGLLSMWYTIVVAKSGGGGGNGWKSWGFCLQAIVCANILTVFLLYSVTATAVLFIHCRALHGEDMAAFHKSDEEEEFGGEYEYLPLPFSNV
ncbi:hypothetical protein ABFS82_12G097000 [Erythranthe guttata]|uniref:Uncharacterized protein n=1 Tax=Erythranthe guttata TaxID=4155 RepID=A0A022QMH5_ERYGU|nr:PREDICTED: uncharacterized protein LOC105967426 [Erythranthe guttata]EYU28809.1 hypothetical protein MIMGU_mgv1a020329mg [Erythranthe guttata]|eukprot:XP_012847474.1 PREDICTED: uncharacterized protein LOC105967426 [Erythranthe guttata]